MGALNSKTRIGSIIKDENDGLISNCQTKYIRKQNGRIEGIDPINMSNCFTSSISDMSERVMYRINDMGCTRMMNKDVSESNDQAISRKISKSIATATEDALILHQKKQEFFVRRKAWHP